MGYKASGLIPETQGKPSREESSEGYSGWGYRIRWYDASGAELESLVIQGEALINDDGFFWLAADGRIDTALLDALLGIES